MKVTSNSALSPSFYTHSVKTYVFFQKCPISKFDPLEAIIQSLSIDHAAISNSDFGDMKVKNLTLTDVTFDQKIDFTGAQVENLVTKNITKLPGLNLTLTGSNVKF